MGWSEAELSLTLLSDRAMARLNRETFGRRGPTNVIAFPVDLGENYTLAEGPCPSPKPPLQPPYRGWAPPAILGEVVISIETTRRQARETGWPWQQLLDFFLIHGILHLLGYDHDDPAREAEMDQKTWELMTLLHPKVRREE